MSVCHPVHMGVTITDDALDLTIQRPSQTLLAGRVPVQWVPTSFGQHWRHVQSYSPEVFYGTDIWWPRWEKCSNLFT